jgi:hypothetical protein
MAYDKKKLYYQSIYMDSLYIYGFIHTIIHDEQRLKQNSIYYCSIDLWVDNSISVAIVQMVYGFRLWTLDRCHPADLFCAVRCGYSTMLPTGT